MNTINRTLAFNPDINKKLEKRSQRLGISVNTLIQSIVEKELSKEDLIYVGMGRYYNINTDFELFDSQKFLTLKEWLFFKSWDERNNDSLAELVDVLKISNQVLESQLFSAPFKAELEKVVVDIKKHLTKRKLRNFTFPINKSGFDYCIFLSELKELQSILDRLDIDIDLCV